MTKKRARLKPLVPPGKAPSQARAPVTSLKLARKLTSKFHALLNEASRVKAEGGAGAAAAQRALEAEMRAMGGREAYQEASALATKHFRSSRVVFKTLVRLGMQPRKGEPPLRLLEIGAVNAQLTVCPWLATRAVDLRSRDPAVEQIDFFDIPVAPAPAWDVVVCAMVVNCVPDAVRRTEMLVRCRDHLVPGGLLFFAVPSRCIDVSAFVTRPRLEGLLAALGFDTLEQKRTPKISFYVLRRRADSAASDGGGGGGGVWRPRVTPRSAADAAALRLLAPPVRQLPAAEQPVTGFTVTDFALAVPTEWGEALPVAAGGAGAPLEPPAASSGARGTKAGGTAAAAAARVGGDAGLAEAAAYPRAERGAEAITDNATGGRAPPVPLVRTTGGAGTKRPRQPDSAPAAVADAPRNPRPRPVTAPKRGAPSVATARADSAPGAAAAKAPRPRK